MDNQTISNEIYQSALPVINSLPVEQKEIVVKGLLALFTDYLATVNSELQSDSESEFRLLEDFAYMYNKIQNQVNNKVNAHIGTPCPVIHSAYKMDESGLPIDNLSVIAKSGRLRVIYSSFYGNGKHYTSDVLINPTYLELCKVANDAILATDDMHHVFFEGLEEVESSEDGVRRFALIMGS